MNDRLLLLGILLSLFCFSCGKEESAVSENILENITVTLDTVSVDIGEELFNPADYEKLTLSGDERRVFFHNAAQSEIHEIDLESLSLIKRYALADDGPDRAPRHGVAFEWLPEDRFFMFSLGLSGIYELDGKKVESITTRLTEIPGLEELEGVGFFRQVWLSPDGKKLMAIPYKHGEWFLRLAVVDLHAQTGKVYELPGLDATKDYQVQWEEEGMSYQGGDFVKGFWLNDQLLIGSGTLADFYRFDWKTDSLELIQNDVRELPKMKTGSIPAKVGSNVEWMDISKRLSKMVNYLEFVFDSSRQRYFRIATQNAKYDDEGRKRGDDVWLQAYDLDFRLIGEQRIEGIIGYPIDPFFSNGKLYGTVLWEEIPGFAVMDLKMD